MTELELLDCIAGGIRRFTRDEFPALESVLKELKRLQAAPRGYISTVIPKCTGPRITPRLLFIDVPAVLTSAGYSRQSELQRVAERSASESAKKGKRKLRS